MSRLLCRFFVTTPVLVLAMSVVAAPRPRNVILVIGDGMGLGHVTAARWIRGNKLQLLRMPVTGIVATHSADDAVTDSAASAAAYATGMKTNNRALSVDANGNPRETVLEVANKSGKATGVVTTTDIWDATPAAFMAHVKDRYDDARAIVQQIISGKADVVLGGGSDLLGKGNFPSLADLKKGDRVVVTTRAELEATKARRVIGLFKTQPNDTEDPDAPLWALAKWAIDELSTDPDGFFLLIENEGIDTASHNRHSGDVAKALTEYDEALRVVLDFAAARRDTLVIAVGDHETGGLDICCEGGDEKGWRMEWSTPDHTGAAIPLFAFGPGSASFGGFMDNTDVGRKLLSFVRK
jgi:alkaline phosphatase